MRLFAVTREAGPAWIDGKGAFEQTAVNGHAAFMAALATEGFALFADPLARSEQSRLRVLLIAEAASEGDVHRRLAEDPWAKSNQLVAWRGSATMRECLVHAIATSHFVTSD